MNELNTHHKELCKRIIKFLLNRDNGKVYLVDQSAKKGYTAAQLAKEVNKGTEVGTRFVNNLVLLSLDLIDRDKEQLDKFKK